MTQTAVVRWSTWVFGLFIDAVADTIRNRAEQLIVRVVRVLVRLVFPGFLFSRIVTGRILRRSKANGLTGLRVTKIEV
jgi:hypothetical protein